MVDPWVVLKEPLFLLPPAAAAVAALERELVEEARTGSVERGSHVGTAAACSTGGVAAAVCSVARLQTVGCSCGEGFAVGVVDWPGGLPGAGG